MIMKCQHFQTHHLLLTLILLISYSTLTYGCNRYATYGEPCNSMSSESYSSFRPTGYAGSEAQCSPYKYLKCERQTGVCKCPDYYNYYWDNYQNRCYIKIGSVCKENFGGIGESWYNHGCPENSICNPATGYCQCRPLFKTDYDYIGCSSALPSFTSRYIPALTFILAVISYLK